MGTRELLKVQRGERDSQRRLSLAAREEGPGGREACEEVQEGPGQRRPGHKHTWVFETERKG